MIAQVTDTHGDIKSTTVPLHISRFHFSRKSTGNEKGLTLVLWLSHKTRVKWSMVTFNWSD